MIDETELNSLRAIRLEPLVESIGAVKIPGESNDSTTYYRTPHGKLQVTPRKDADSYHFWAGALAGKSGHGAVSFVIAVGLATDFKSACQYLGARPQSAEPLQPMVTRAQPGPVKPYKSPPHVFGATENAKALAHYLTVQRGIPVDIIAELANQPHPPIKAGYGPRYEHYVLFPVRNHADHKKPEVGSILRWKDPGDPNHDWFGGKKAPKAPGTKTDQGWWQVGPYPAATTMVVEAPIDALSLWSALNPKDRETTRIIATGGEGGLDAPGIWHGTKRLILAQDNDSTGDRQASKAQDTARKTGYVGPVARLAPPLKDWNAAWLADPNAVRRALAAALQPTRTKSR